GPQEGSAGPPVAARRGGGRERERRRASARAGSHRIRCGDGSYRAALVWGCARGCLPGPGSWGEPFGFVALVFAVRARTLRLPSNDRARDGAVGILGGCSGASRRPRERATLGGNRVAHVRWSGLGRSTRHGPPPQQDPGRSPAAVESVTCE